MTLPYAARRRGRQVPDVRLVDHELIDEMTGTRGLVTPCRRPLEDADGGSTESVHPMHPRQITARARREPHRRGVRVEEDLAAIETVAGERRPPSVDPVPVQVGATEVGIVDLDGPDLASRVRSRQHDAVRGAVGPSPAGSRGLRGDSTVGSSSGPTSGRRWAPRGAWSDTTMARRLGPVTRRPYAGDDVAAAPLSVAVRHRGWGEP